MRYKCCFLAAIIVLSVLTIEAQAQYIAIVPEISAGGNQFSFRSEGQKAEKTTFGDYYAIGLGLDLPYNKYLSIRFTGLYAARNGSFVEADIDSPFYNYSINFRINELCLGAEILYIRSFKKRSQLYGGLGLFQSYHLGGKIMYSVIDENEELVEYDEEDILFGNDVDKDLKKTNYGLKVRVGYRIRRHVGIEFFTRMGINDLFSQKERFSSVRTLDMGLTLSYSLFFDE